MNYSSNNVALYGTDVEVDQSRQLLVGEYHFEVGSSGIKSLKLRGIELVRCISLVARDENWGFLKTIGEPPEVHTIGSRIRLRFLGRFESSGGVLTYEMKGIFDSDIGQLDLVASFIADSDFYCNLVGPVIILGSKECAGQEANVSSRNGTPKSLRFPETVVSRPFFRDVSSFEFTDANGHHVAFEFQGALFELEDQRAYADDSFKAYSRSIDLPWPYTIEAGKKFEQRVRARVSSPSQNMYTVKPATKVERISLTANFRIPLPILSIMQTNLSDALNLVNQGLVPRRAHLLGLYDPDNGCQSDILELYRRLTEGIEGTFHLEFILPCLDIEEEFSALAHALEKARLKPKTIRVFPAVDIRGNCSTGLNRKPPEQWRILSIAREFFEHIPIGSGTCGPLWSLLSDPPEAAWDFISFSHCAITHSSDDLTTVRSVNALTDCFMAAKKLRQNTPICVGPSGIAMRFNTLGKTTYDFNSNYRQIKSPIDPRSRGLFGLSWLVAYVAAIIKSGISSFCPASICGANGFLFVRQSHPQPRFDNDPLAVKFPAYHLVSCLIKSSGNAVAYIQLDNQPGSAAFAFFEDQHLIHWITNTTSREKEVRLDLSADGAGWLHRFSPDNFADTITVGYEVSNRAVYWSRLPETIELGAYETIHIKEALSK
ncbi:MAG: hypothetical protein RIM72_16085 [Alphaproteobacteria bacterium]